MLEVGLIEMSIFFFLLVFGYIYEWKKGGLDLDLELD